MFRETYYPPQETNNEALSTDSVYEREKSILETLREKSRGISLLLASFTAFAFLKVAEVQAEGFAGTGDQTKAERTDAKAEMSQMQNLVRETLQAVKDNLRIKENKDIAQGFLKQWFFDFSVTQEVAYSVIKDAGEKVPQNIEQQIEERKLEILKEVEILKSKIKEQGDAFNARQEYRFEGNASNIESAHIAREGEEIEWLKRLGVMNNKEKLDRYKSIQLQKMMQHEHENE